MAKQLPESAYQTLKWAVTIVFPAIATLYWALGNIWGFPYIEEVLGTFVAIETFLGALLGISTVNYYNDETRYDGYLGLDSGDKSAPLSGLELSKSPYDLHNGDRLTIKVQDLPPAGQ